VERFISSNIYYNKRTLPRSKVRELSQEDLTKTLKEIVSEHREIEGIAIVSIEGLPITSYLPSGIDEVVISAITATMLSVGEKANLQLNKGFLRRVILEGDNGYIIVTSIDENTLLTVFTSKRMKIGLIFLAIQKAIEKIKPVMEKQAIEAMAEIKF